MYPRWRFYIGLDMKNDEGGKFLRSDSGRSSRDTLSLYYPWCKR